MVWTMPAIVRPRPRRSHAPGLLSWCSVARGFAGAWVAGAIGCGCNSSWQDETCSQTAPVRETCAGDAAVGGIDVSTYQGAVVWSLVKASGVAFAFARVSDGTTAPDPRFAVNWTAMKEAGLLRGCYQYFRAGEDAVAQASLVVAGLNDAGGLTPGDLPVVMDVETDDGQSAATVREAMASWLASVSDATGRAPVIYTNSAMSSVIGSGFAQYGLWVADWGPSCPVLPSGWPVWRFWQYSDMGSVAGVSGVVDLDKFDGTLSALMAFARGESDEADNPDAADADEGSAVDGSTPESHFDANSGSVDGDQIKLDGDWESVDATAANLGTPARAVNAGAAPPMRQCAR